jgi:hypothetical protein
MTKKCKIQSANKISNGLFGLMVLSVLANAQNVDCSKDYNKDKPECQDRSHGHGGGYIPGHAYGSSYSGATTGSVAHNPVKEVAKTKMATPIYAGAAAGSVAHNPVKEVAKTKMATPIKVAAAPVATKSSFFSSSSTSSHGSVGG